MMLSDVRDYIDSLEIADHVYQGKLDAKMNKSFGVYNSKHGHEYKTAIGGLLCESYGVKYVTFLVHWNKSPRDTEKAAVSLFDAIRETREATVNDERIKFIQPLTHGPVDVGTDENGTFEMVIEAAVVHERRSK